MKILLIDNYDSFTFNLYHYLSSFKIKVEVFRNDKINASEIIKKKYSKIVISPGPGNPRQIGSFPSSHGIPLPPGRAGKKCERRPE